MVKITARCLGAAMVLLLASGCGSESDDGAAADDDQQAAVAADDSSDGLAGADSAGGSGGSESAGGSCEVATSGDLSQTWSVTSDHITTSFSTSYWSSELARDALGVEQGEALMIINCGDAEGTLALSLIQAAGTTEEMLPLGPGSYEVVPDGFGGDDQAQPGQFHTFGIQLSDPETLWEPAGPGTLEVTTFDGSMIAGSFSYPLASADGSTAQLDASFQFSCARFGDACS